MEYFVQQLINGITLGSIYGLIAIGYTMVYGIIGMINFAHGDVFMVGGFIALIAFLALVAIGITAIPLALFLVLLVAMALTALYGWTVERIAYRPLRAVVPPGAADLRDRHVDHPAELRADRAGRARQAAAAAHHRRPHADVERRLRRAALQHPDHRRGDDARADGRLLLAGRASTRLGRDMRACEQDLKMAALLGVDVDRTISLTFVIGAALAAVAGIMYLLYYGVIDFFIGFVAGVKAFTAAVLGGIGSLPGAMLGGLLIGLIETFWSAYFSIEYKDVAAFSILIIVLIFLPTGILGRPEVEKV